MEAAPDSVYCYSLQADGVARRLHVPSYTSVEAMLDRTYWKDRR